MTKSATKKLNSFTELEVHDREEESKVLAKAKAREKQLKKQGYRWYEVKPTYRVLIPCDESGEPTKEGLKKLQKHKEMLNIV